MDWPIHAGISLYGREDENGPLFEIFDSSKPIAFTGSVMIPGKGLALANLNKDLVSYMRWNTLSAKLEKE